MDGPAHRWGLRRPVRRRIDHSDRRVGRRCPAACPGPARFPARPADRPDPPAPRHDHPPRPGRRGRRRPGPGHRPLPPGTPGPGPRTKGDRRRRQDTRRLSYHETAGHRLARHDDPMWPGPRPTPDLRQEQRDAGLRPAPGRHRPDRRGRHRGCPAHPAPPRCLPARTRGPLPCRWWPPRRSFCRLLGAARWNYARVAAVLAASIADVKSGVAPICASNTFAAL